MADALPPPDQFWLLTGEVPAGPFSVPQVHAELAAGRATWETAACPVGGSAWLPLLKTPGIGPAAHPVADPPAPTAGPSRVAAEAPPATPPPPAAHVPFTPVGATPPAPPATPAAGGRRTTDRVATAAGVGVLLVALAAVGAAAYGVYEWVRPLTATEVCDRFNEARTAADAKKYATPRMYPLVDAVYADKAASDPNATYELTQEVDGPRPGTKRVGFRGEMFVPDAGRRVRVEGRFVVVRSDGWKVDDAEITGVEGVSLPGPVSLVDDHARSANPVGAAAPRTGPWPVQKTGVPPSLWQPLSKPWYEVVDPRKNKLVLWGLVMGGASLIGAAWKWVTSRSNPPVNSA